MTRGEVWWADPGVLSGAASGFRRPVPVVQDDGFDAGSIRSTAVVSLTSNLDPADAPGSVLFSRRESRLSRDAAINVAQVSTLDKRRHAQRVGRLTAHMTREADEGLQLVLGLR